MRIYLADLLPANVRCIIYFDSGIIVVGDVAKLWAIDLGKHVLGAAVLPREFYNYFIPQFWAKFHHMHK